jgi:hypothetical protein
MVRILAASAVLAAALIGVSPSLAQHQHEAGGAPQRLGKVHFETSCAPGAQADFDRGVALLHSFWFSAAIDSFNAVLAKDPACGMAHWGIAMSWWGNPFAGARSPKAIAEGTAASAKATSAGAKTPRERDYIAAVALLFRDADKVDQRARTVAYEKAMEQIAAKYTDDSEARLFYALSLEQTQLPTDKTYANLLKAGEILEREFVKQPDHPGIAHYIIHGYDVPALAPKALDAARRYAKIAPDAPHALHMPSHTFTRLGLWQESIDTNIASAAAARKDGTAASEELHAIDYQVYAYLQIAKDAAAKKMLDELTAIGNRILLNTAGAAAPAPAGYYALAAVPARYAIERSQWKDAAALQPRDTPFLFPDAISYYARALGAARSGNPAAVAKDAEKLASIRDGLKGKGDVYWPGQVEIMRRVVLAWAAYAEGRKDEGIAALREAADMEDATEKSAISPGQVKPARELLGEMLLDAGRAAEALKELETSIMKEPGRFGGLYNAARAAEASGDRAKARKYYAQLAAMCKTADSPARPELQAARKAAGS